MMDEINIAAGIAVKLLLIGIVLTTAAVGVLGVAPVASHATASGTTDVVAPQLAFPIDNLTVGSDYLTALDGKGNDPYPTAFPIDNVTMAFPINNVTAAFPIDNVTVSGAAWDVRGANPVRWTDSADVTTQFRMQDMDPYAIPRNPDGLPQDMDPY